MEERVIMYVNIEVTMMISLSHLIFLWIDFWKMTLNRDSNIPFRTSPDFKYVLSDMVATNHVWLFRFK